MADDTGNNYTPRKAGSTMMGVIIGAAAGVVAGLMLAPKSGKETRAEIEQKAMDARSKIKQKAVDLKDKAKEKISSAVDKGQEVAASY